MRLRQIALASRDLDGVTGALAAVFDLRVAYRDPHIVHYGLRNAVLPAGAGFIEVVEPIRADASASRFLDRRGGDAGYMVILQTPDAEAERARIAGLGVRVVDDIDRPDYRAAHFHPGDFGGVLVSVDQQRTTGDYLEPFGDWWPAGGDWRASRSSQVMEMAAVTLVSTDAAALAGRWSNLLNLPLDPPLRLPLARGEVRFEGGAARGTEIRRIDLKVADVDAAARRAQDFGLDLDQDGVLIGGVRFKPLAQ